MKQCLYFVVALGCGLIVSACKQGPSGLSSYHAKDRWHIADVNAHHPLKGQPIEIMDSVYLEKDENGMDSAKKFLNYEKWVFDKQGALSYRRLFFTDSFWHETIIRHSDSGDREFMVAHSGHTDKKPDTVMIFKLDPQPDGKLKETSFDPEGHASRISFLSFPSGSDVLKKESQGTTAGGIKVSKVTLNVYDGDRLLQLTEQSVPGDSARADYFYSARGFVDSIVNRTNGEISRRDVYKNNEWGDPLRLLVLSPMGDTVDDYTWRYEYDRQGNWSKRWERRVFSKSPYGTISLAGENYPVTLTTRKIIYPGGATVAGD